MVSAMRRPVATRIVFPLGQPWTWLIPALCLWFAAPALAQDSPTRGSPPQGNPAPGDPAVPVVAPSPLTAALTVPPLMPVAGAEDPVALAEPALTSFALAYDAWLAEGIMRSLGGRPPRAQLLAKARARPDSADPFRAAAPSAQAGGFGLSALAKESAGSEHGIAFNVAQRFASSNSFSSDFTLRHAAGPIDTSVEVTGVQVFAPGQPMALSYRSQALLAVMPAVQVGVSARGALGTLTTPSPEGTQVAGAVMQVHLLGHHTSLSTDAGYDFGFGPMAMVMPDHVHVKLDFNMKL